MESEIKHDRQIEEIARQITCKKGFSCIKTGFKNIPEVKNIGLPDSVQCLSKNPENCEYAFNFADIHVCKCPIRVYIAKNVEK